MNSDQLIEKLAQENRPIKRISILRGLVRWTLVAAFCVFLSISIVGLRHDWKEMTQNFSMLFQSILLILAAISSAAAAYIFSIPAHRLQKYSRFAALIPIGIWLFLILLDFPKHPSIEFDSFFGGMLCLADIFIFAIVPSLIAFGFVMKAAPTKVSWTGFLIVLAACSIGALATQWSCSNSHSLHLLIWHFLPVVGISGLGIFLGRRLLDW